MNNDIFCIVPFLNFSSTNDGHPRLCCQASTWKDINIKNLNITNESILDEVKNVLLTNISNSIPKSTNINEVKFINYKK